MKETKENSTSYTHYSDAMCVFFLFVAEREKQNYFNFGHLLLFYTLRRTCACECVHKRNAHCLLCLHQVCLSYDSQSQINVKAEKLKKNKNKCMKIDDFFLHFLFIYCIFISVLCVFIDPIYRPAPSLCVCVQKCEYIGKIFLFIRETKATPNRSGHRSLQSIHFANVFFIVSDLRIKSVYCTV